MYAFGYHPVDGRRSGHGVSKDVLPLGEDQVGGDAEGATLVAFGDEREEHLRFLSTLGQVAQVIQQQSPQDGVVDPFLAEGRCVDENGLAGVLPGAEMCPCVVSLLSESLGLVGRQLPVELLGGADCQACVPYGVALHLIGGWLGPVGQSGEDILLDCQPGRFGGAVGAQEFDGPVVGEPAGVGPEFKLGPLVPVWVDSYLPGFPCGTF